MTGDRYRSWTAAAVLLVATIAVVSYIHVASLAVDQPRSTRLSCKTGGVFGRIPARARGDSANTGFQAQAQVTSMWTEIGEVPPGIFTGTVAGPLALNLPPRNETFVTVHPGWL